MADDNFTVDVSFNTDGISGGTSNTGNSETNKILKDILKTLQKQTSETSQTNKLGMSGLIKSGASASIAALISALTMLAAPSASKWGEDTGAKLFSPDVYGSGNIGYDSFRDQKTGERLIAEIDEKRGTVITVLTEQEAREQNILDKQGDIVRNAKVQSDQWEKNTANLQRTGRDLNTNEIYLKSFQPLILESMKELEAQGTIQKKITKELETYKKWLANRNKKYSGGSATTLSGNSGTSYINEIQQTIAATRAYSQAQTISGPIESAQERIMKTYEKSNNFTNDFLSIIR